MILRDIHIHSMFQSISHILKQLEPQVRSAKALLMPLFPWNPEIILISLDGTEFSSNHKFEVYKLWLINQFPPNVPPPPEIRPY